VVYGEKKRPFIIVVYGNIRSVCGIHIHRPRKNNNFDYVAQCTYERIYCDYYDKFNVSNGKKKQKKTKQNAYANKVV
jgi:hypothetical protein